MGRSSLGKNGRIIDNENWRRFPTLVLVGLFRWIHLASGHRCILGLVKSHSCNDEQIQINRNSPATLLVVRLVLKMKSTF